MANTINKFLFDKAQIPKFASYLDLSALRHRLLAGNVANVATPKYENRDIDFKSEYKRVSGNSHSLQGTVTHENHIPTGSSPHRAVKVHETKVKDGNLNSVDIDETAADIAQNELNYTIGARLLQRKFEGLKKVINSK